MALAIRFSNRGKNYDGPNELLEVLKEFIASINSPSKNVIFWVHGQKLILQYEADKWLKQINGIGCSMQYQFKMNILTVEWFNRESQDVHSVAYQIDANKLAKAILCFKNDLKTLVIIFRNNGPSLLEFISTEQTRATITIDAEKKAPINIELPPSLQMIEEFRFEVASELIDWKNFKIILHPQSIQFFDRIRLHSTKSEKFRKHVLPSYNYNRLMMHLADRNIITTNASLIVKTIKFTKRSQKTPIGLYVLLREPSDNSQLIARIDNEKYTYMKNFVCEIACMEGRQANRMSPLMNTLKRNEEEDGRQPEVIRLVPVAKKEEHKSAAEDLQNKRLDMILERIAEVRAEQENRIKPLVIKPQALEDELVIEDDDERWEDKEPRKKTESNYGH